MSRVPPSASSELPEVDERLVAPGSRYEIMDGQVVYVPPAFEPHGTSHAQLAALVKAHAADGFSVAVDMLTRTSRTDDIAPDVSVFPSARTERGGRQLEQLAFEIASTQALSDVARKARKLAGRGVRRVFAIDLDSQRVLEWSRDTDGWAILDLAGVIIDAALAVPMPIAPLLDAAHADDATVAAFRARRHRAFVEEREEGREEGRNEGLREILAITILDILEVRGLVATAEQEARIRGEQEIAQLERWRGRAKLVPDVAAVFEPG